jgi:hypothetical protein
VRRSAWLVVGWVGCAVPLPGADKAVDGPSDGGNDVVAAGDPFASRGLRLLNRAEYLATVRALFPTLASDTCTATADCNLTTQSCEESVCVADACDVHTFTWSSSAPVGGAVVVAGSFNGWAATASAGGLPMTWSASLGRYWAKTSLPDGTHAYKIVVDGTQWFADPENPQTTPDGFGGNNSVWVQTCAGAAPVDAGWFDPTSGWSPDVRPEGFAFDNAADRRVDASRAESFLDAAAAIAARVVPDAAAADALWGCDVDEETCVRSGVVTWGRAAWRRTLAAEEVERLVGYALAEDTPARGVSVVLQALLTSPSFLYRSEVGTLDGTSSWLNGDETAAAMAYGLTGTPPDETLRAEAASGALATSEGRRAAAVRLLATPAARQTWRRFVQSWFGLDGLATQTKSTTAYPAWTEALRDAALRETLDLAEAVRFEGDGKLDTLLTASWTVADAPIRALYGLPSGEGRVDLPPTRAGVLGHASILAATAHSDQSSPVRRGLWVRQRLLCETFPPPPPTAGGVPDVDPAATTRERFDQHSSDPSCAACHTYIDRLGFGFETFDGIGAYRTTENGQPIDAGGVLKDVEGRGTGTEVGFSTLPELGALLAASEAVERCAVAQSVRFLWGLPVRADDARLTPFVEAFRASGGDLGALWVDLVVSDAFVERAP